jgi:hypothetical protein
LERARIGECRPHAANWHIEKVVWLTTAVSHARTPSRVALEQHDASAGPLTEDTHHGSEPHEPPSNDGEVTGGRNRGRDPCRAHRRSVSGGPTHDG